MKTNRLSAYLCGLLSVICLPILADVAIIGCDESNVSIFAASPEDTLGSVSQQMTSHLAEGQGEALLFVMNDTTIDPAVCFYCVANKETLPRAGAASENYALAGFRSYDTPVTPDQKDNIAYIINTLSHHGYAKLLLLRSDLEKAGARVDNVHPLRHLEVIFTDETLIVGIRNVNAKAIKWNNWVNGLARSLGEEQNRSNITTEQVADFAKNVKIDPSLITFLAEQGRWPEFLQALVTHVPRKGNSRRYDM